MEEDFIEVDNDVCLEPDQNIFEEDLTKSVDYTQVIFHNIAENYSGTVDIHISFSLTSLIEPKQHDWIGIYKLGWTKISDYVLREWSTMPPADQYTPGNGCDNSVNFQISSLPRLEQEFFQFCYVSGESVCGASTPFQVGLKPSTLEPYVGVDEDDIVVVKTKSAALEDDLDQVIAARDNLIDTLMTFNCIHIIYTHVYLHFFTYNFKENDKQKKTIEELNRKCLEFEQCCVKRDSDIESISQCWKESDLKLTAMEKMECNSSNENIQLKKDLELKDLSIAKKKKTISEFTEKTLKINADNDVLHGQVLALESKLAVMHEQISQLDDNKQRQLASHTDKVLSMKTQYQDLELKYHTLIDDYNTMQADQAENTESEAAAKQQLSSMKETYETQIIACQQEFLVSQLECESLKTSLMQAKENIEAMEKDIKQMKTINEHDAEQISSITDENTLLTIQLSEKSAAMYSLQVALKMLRDKLGRQQCEIDTRRNERIEMNKKMTEINISNKELKQRINMANSQYKEMYVEYSKTKGCDRL